MQIHIFAAKEQAPTQCDASSVFSMYQRLDSFNFAMLQRGLYDSIALKLPDQAHMLYNWSVASSWLTKHCGVKTLAGMRHDAFFTMCCKLRIGVQHSTLMSAALLPTLLHPVESEWRVKWGVLDISRYLTVHRHRGYFRPSDLAVFCRIPCTLMLDTGISTTHALPSSTLWGTKNWIQTNTLSLAELYSHIHGYFTTPSEF